MLNGIKNFFTKCKNKINTFLKITIYFIKNNKAKLEDLYQTNYNLTFNFMQNGRMKDASFRFTLMELFWPNKIEIKYHHAICFILMHNDYKAFKKLNKILKKYPDYQLAEELLYKLDTCDGLDEFIEEYKKEFNIIDTNNIQDNNDKNDNEQKTENNDETTK